MHKPRLDNVMPIYFRAIGVPVPPIITVAKYPRALKLYFQ